MVPFYCSQYSKQCLDKNYEVSLLTPHLELMLEHFCDQNKDRCGDIRKEIIALT